MIEQNILFVGCGKMGSALLDGLLPNVKDKSQILIISPNGGDYPVSCIPSPADIPADFISDIVIFAVKPQILDMILPDYIAICNDDTLVISVAAGKTIEFFAQHLNSPIIRTMPNLPAIVGKGATVLCANAAVNNEHKSKAEQLFKAVGETFWLDDESLMDAVTAISGSGPAYVFYFLESLINAGIELGLPEELAVMLAKSTIAGSAALADNSDKSAKQLKEQVISPKGTTEAGLSVLSADDALEKLVEQTAKAACQRSKELAG